MGSDRERTTGGCVGEWWTCNFNVLTRELAQLGREVLLVAFVHIGHTCPEFRLSPSSTCRDASGPHTVIVSVYGVVFCTPRAPFTGVYNHVIEAPQPQPHDYHTHIIVTVFDPSERRGLSACWRKVQGGSVHGFQVS